MLVRTRRSTATPEVTERHSALLPALQVVGPYSSCDRVRIFRAPGTSQTRSLRHPRLEVPRMWRYGTISSSTVCKRLTKGETYRLFQPITPTSFLCSSRGK